ncbi:hypothetical protein LPJ66_001724 [Kickxella alabastrina]|uniref:Uncharacterized protein n=1 Tax=Kickxella alabastrina TaxID=61397 RepID=A0ACC1ISJ2_9FUNG|nr:hypothetical protein LPJ66_001724 [Kickxella alabastrina]
MLNTSGAGILPAGSVDARATNERSRGTSQSVSSSVLSEDEFHECKSNNSASAKLNLDIHTMANESRALETDSISSSSTEAVPKSPSGSQKSQQHRYRSLTSSGVPSGKSSSHGGSLESMDSLSNVPLPAMAPTPLRRSVTTTTKAFDKDKGAVNSLVEERARRAVKAMAEACTTGISVREADERRSRAFNRLLVDSRLHNQAERAPSGGLAGREGVRGSSSSESLAMQPRLKQNPIHQVSSHGHLLGAAAARSRSAKPDDTSILPAGNGTLPVVNALTPEPDGRTLSMTSDRNAIIVARSASLEARVDRRTRDKLAQWLVCFGTVQFDVDQGPTLNLLYPHVQFSESERAAICFSSMPDSTIHELYDSVYTFHFRVDPVRLGLPKDRIFLYGHVFFRQKRDPLMRRGGFQRSVVVISHLPYHGLFSRMAHMLGPLYFDLGTAILEAAAQNVSSWPAPRADGAYELPFLGTALTVELPARDASQLLETSKFPLERFDPGEHILAGVTFDGLFRSFRDTLDDLWACWELMILGESLVVLADTPSRCSEAVVSLVDIIFPITYCGDYRPYFTIQDPDFRAVVSKTHVPPNTVVGVSNPFFSEALSHWPHKLFLGTSGRMSQMHGASARKARAFSENSNGSSGIGGSNAAMGGGSSSAAGSGAVGSKGIKQGLQSKHKCAISKDRVFTEHLLNALKTGKQPPWMVNNMLRRYFMDLTVQFLAPLNRYFSTLIPQVQSSTAIVTQQQHSRDRQRAAPSWAHARGRGSTGSASMAVGASASSSSSELSWFVPPGKLRPWRTDDFMASLASFGISPQLSSRHNTATAADVFVSVFSTNSTSGSGDQSGALPTAPSAGGSGAAGSAAGSAQSTSFLPWKNKKAASKKISDEWLNLYTQFLKCGNFATWLARRTNEAQRALLSRFRQEICRGDVHAWCRGYDHPLALGTQQLAAELEMLDLTTMDLGQSSSSGIVGGGGGGGASANHSHVKHVFYHGQAEDERVMAERHRQQALREQRERLAQSEQPVYGSDGALIGYTRRKTNPENAAPPAAARVHPAAAHGVGAGGAAVRKQLGRRITHARRPQHVMLQAAWQIAEVMGPQAMARIPLSHRSTEANSAIDAEMRACGPSSAAETLELRAQLSVMLEYLAAEEGCLFLPLVADDYVDADADANV